MEALILSEGSAVVKSYSRRDGRCSPALRSVRAFASRVNRLRLVCGVTLFFATHLIVFYLLGSAGVVSAWPSTCDRDLQPRGDRAVLGLRQRLCSRSGEATLSVRGTGAPGTGRRSGLTVALATKVGATA